MAEDPKKISQLPIAGSLIGSDVVVGNQGGTTSRIALDTIRQYVIDGNLDAFDALTGAADKLPYFNGTDTLALAAFTAQARAFLAAVTQADQRAALGLVLGGANGVAQLGADGLLPPALLPALAVNDTFTVASQAAMLALTAQRGDVAIRTDLSGAAYILTADAPATLANWVPIQQNLGAALQALGALTPATDTLGYFTGAGAAASTTFTAAARTLLAAATAAAQRTSLGVLAQADKPAWTAYTPTITPTAGAYTSAGVAARYLVLFGMCFVQIALTVTTKGTGTFPTLTLPFPALSGSAGHLLQCRENLVNKKMGQAAINSALTGVLVSAYDNTELISADGCSVLISGSYPIA